jgi:hypothetical protein
LVHAIDVFNQLWGSEVSIQSLSGKDKVQRFLTETFEKKKLADLLASKECPKEKARILSCSTSASSAWLRCIPSPRNGTYMDSAEFCISIRTLLGILDPIGGRLNGAFAISRHNLIRDTIHYEAERAHLSPSIETPHLLPQHPGRKPADILLPRFSSGRALCIDVSVVNPQQPSLNASAAITQGYAVENRFKAKNRKFKEDCQAEKLDFLPVVVETFGLWHPTSLALFKKISRRRAIRENRSVPLVHQEFLSRLSVALMRSNADFHLSAQFSNRFVDPLWRCLRI